MIVSDIYTKCTKKWYVSRRKEEADKLVDFLHFLHPALKIIC